jgi:hypothetical protein
MIMFRVSVLNKSTMKTILLVTAVGKILPDDHKLTQIGQDVSFHKTTK